MTKCQHYNQNTVLLTKDDNLPITPSWFDSNLRQEQSSTDSQYQPAGRGNIHFLTTQHGEFVVRKYKRGGLISKLISSRFLYLGIKYCRSFREFELLDYMQSQGLPVPSPIAALCRIHGISYEASIITRRIPDALELFHLTIAANTNDKTLPKINWQAIGGTIRRFHSAGIDHTDLNCHNIMLDQNNKVWLIDFDKCRQRGLQNYWQKSNLARLKRSFRKEGRQQGQCLLSDSNWQQLLKGYYA